MEDQVKHVSALMSSGVSTRPEELPGGVANTLANATYTSPLNRQPSLGFGLNPSSRSEMIKSCHLQFVHAASTFIRGVVESVTDEYGFSN